MELENITLSEVSQAISYMNIDPIQIQQCYEKQVTQKEGCLLGLGWRVKEGS
jgi:hypothetical protein